MKLGEYQQATNDFTTGLCDCFSDRSSCCLTICCPCFSFGQIAEIVDQGSISCCAAGTFYLLLAPFVGFQWIYSCTYRAKLKAQLGIPKSTCDDCCSHFWCQCCALAQEYRELKHRGYDPSLGWEGNMEKQKSSTLPPQILGRMIR
ncbi:cell number regulator 9 [Beta vulgaris subsp. vulgaris]|uniref:cell number regulator 9 n=1 Tax=Beta vulgaris subsp. vulgaris TaxID=3555 RepID=UPI0020375108|nr:cell number regulator 9 [Beta vulgaris subsp. vulgaris]